MNTKTLTELRNVTGLGIAQCSKLLKDSNGDYEKALSSASSIMGRKIERMKDRNSSSGKVFSYIHIGGKKGGLIHICSETDFVSNTDEFSKLGNDIAMHIVAMEPTDVDSLLKQPFVKDHYTTVGDLINSIQVKVGEKIEVKNFSIFG